MKVNLKLKVIFDARAAEQAGIPVVSEKAIFVQVIDMPALFPGLRISLPLGRDKDTIFVVGQVTFDTRSGYYTADLGVLGTDRPLTELNKNEFIGWGMVMPEPATPFDLSTINEGIDETPYVDKDGDDEDDDLTVIDGQGQITRGRNIYISDSNVEIHNSTEPT